MEFQKCLDQTDPVEFRVIKDIIKQELKQPLEQVFSYIDPQPLASASVAQVIKRWHPPPNRSLGWQHA